MKNTKTHRSYTQIVLLCLFSLFNINAVIHQGSSSVRIEKLLAEKQAKLKKLESCKGTTKNLKIAGLSTLGITAAGVAVNVAEAVVLNKKDKELQEANTKQKNALKDNEKYKPKSEPKAEDDANKDVPAPEAPKDDDSGKSTKPEAGKKGGNPVKPQTCKENQEVVDGKCQDKEYDDVNLAIHTGSDKSCNNGFIYDKATNDCIQDNTGVLTAVAEHNELNRGHSCPQGTKWSDTKGECVSIIKKQIPKVICDTENGWILHDGKCVKEQDDVKPELAKQLDLKTGHSCEPGKEWSTVYNACVVIESQQSVQSLGDNVWLGAQ